MVGWIVENKEWLFSGAGLFAFTLIRSFFVKSKKQDSPKESHSLEVQNEEADPSNLKTELTETDKVAKRFCTVLELMNEGRRYTKFTIPQLAQLMKLHKISELENVFTGEDEPTFLFIEDFAKTFGVNAAWLTEGKGAPFLNELDTFSDPLDYLPLIEELKPEGIYFVRENSDTAPAFMILELTNWKYFILQRTWHISDVVGAGGQRQLYSFYALIKELRDKRGLHTKCWGITLNKNDFDVLLCGGVFPGKYFDSGFSEDPWWDDLTDINHKYPIAENYEHWYGKSFVRAQRIIKWYISERKNS